MSELARLQDAMAAGLLHGQFDDLAADVLSGPIAADEAFGLHRNTVLYALTQALRLEFPTVDALVGEVFFDQAGLAFIAGQPPRQACLTGYGAGFADFLQGYSPAETLPYLADVARLDNAVEAVGGCSVGTTGSSLDLGEAVLTLDGSLRVLRLTFPAAAIRDAVEAQDDEGLARIDPSPRPNAHALWRTPAGAAFRPLGAASAAFLAAVLVDAPVETALAAALAESDDLSSLQTEIFAAPFARLTVKSNPETDR